MNNEDDRTSGSQALKAALLGISAATNDEGEKFVLLTLRLNPHSFEVTDILVPVHQAQQRLQVDLAELLERHRYFKETH